MTSVKSIVKMAKNQLFVDIPPLELNNKPGLADWAMILFFAQRLMTYTFSSIFGIKGIVLFIAILAGLTLIALVVRCHDKDYEAIYMGSMVVFVIIAFVFLSLLRNPALKFWIFGAEWNFVNQVVDPRKAIFGFILVLLVRKPAHILRNAYWSSLGMFVYLIYQIILFEYHGTWYAYFNISESRSQYNMSLGYEMIFVALVFLAVSFVRGSLTLLVLSGIASGLAIYYGSRGVVILLLVFSGLLLLFWSGNSWKLSSTHRRVKGRHLSVILIFFLVILLTISALVPLQRGLMDQIAPPMTTPDGETLPRPTDEDSRTVQSILEGDFFAPSGRFTIWRASFQAFLDQPLWGQGFYGDRPYVGLKFNWGYSHNVILEFMSQYGVLGLSFISSLIYFAFYFLAKGRDATEKILMILFLALCSKLLVSDSYLISSYFWIILALILIHLDLFNRVKPKIRVGSLIAVVLIAMTAMGFYFVKDKGTQDFKTIEIENPTLIIATNGSSRNNLEIAEILSAYDLTAVNFLNGFDLETGGEDILNQEDINYLTTLGWTFEDGGYRYLNPYARTADIQEEYRLANLDYFHSMGLGSPSAYLPPYNANNSTVQFRAMSHYRFILKTRNAQGAKPYKTITYPQVLEMELTRLRWETQEEKESLMFYLENVKNQGALALLYIDVKNADLDQVAAVAQKTRELGFVNSSFRELDLISGDYQGTLSWSNYWANSYLGQTLRKLIG